MSNFCEPMDWSMSGYPVLCYLPAFAQYISTESVMLCTHLNLRHPFFCLQPFPVSVFSKDSAHRHARVCVHIHTHMHAHTQWWRITITTPSDTHTPNLLYPVLCWWSFRLLPCLDCCKQCCSEHCGMNFNQSLIICFPFCLCEFDCSRNLI